jgi:2Fe-2S ferredoxin
MSRIFAESRDGQVMEMEVPEGTALVDACDLHGAPVPFCCRIASCGTCRVAVLEGADDLLPPAEDELDVLRIYDCDPRQVRLACQARLGAGARTVRVRALEE